MSAEPIDYVLTRLAGSIASATILVPGPDQPSGGWRIPSEEVPAVAVVETILTALARLPTEDKQTLLHAWGWWGADELIAFDPGTDLQLCGFCQRVIIREPGANGFWHLIDLATGAQTLACPGAEPDALRAKVAYPA